MMIEIGGGWLFAAEADEIEEEDLFLITADHGNDPTWRGTDHTRERVPLLMRFRGRRGCLGIRSSFADVAATLTDFFEVDAWETGQSFLGGGAR